MTNFIAHDALSKKSTVKKSQLSSSPYLRKTLKHLLGPGTVSNDQLNKKFMHSTIDCR
jgi:hypothetical protein